MPAHNEEAVLGDTLAAIERAARAIGRPYEMVVVDDASIDRTAEIAAAHGARVEPVAHRNIAATRNAGARSSRGRYIFFVDADTHVNARTIGMALRAMEGGAVGGGAATFMLPGEVVPLHDRIINAMLTVGGVLTGFASGQCMFCTREAFEATGGFDGSMYWGEDNAFALALKREGRFAAVWYPALTSGRRFRKRSLRFSSTRLRGLFSDPGKLFTDRSHVEARWYDSDRTDDNRLDGSLPARIARGIGLVVVIAVLAGLAWCFTPGGWGPWPGRFGRAMSLGAVAMAHAGLAFWLAAWVNARNLLRQKRPTSIVRSLLTIAAFAWIGWRSATVVFWGYSRLWDWLEHFL
ncbi:MAG: glycosyltransferase [Rhizobiaceae bacterium]|nr:glycosyltransferase [Rhizobiaceae bacterium]